MSDKATAILGAIIGFQSSAIIFLAIGFARVRERLARIEQRLADKFNNHHNSNI